MECESDAEILLGQKKELLAELEVERHEVRRKLFVSSEIDNLGGHGEGGEEVLDDSEKGIENYADILDTGNQNNLYGVRDDVEDTSCNELDSIEELELKNTLLELEIQGLKESLASFEEIKVSYIEQKDSEVEQEEAAEQEQDVVESFKSLWLDRERLVGRCSALETKLVSCLTPASPPPPTYGRLPGGSNTSLPSPDLILDHSFKVVSALVRARDETASAMATMRKARARYLGLPKDIRPPLSLSQASSLFVRIC